MSRVTQTDVARAILFSDVIMRTEDSVCTTPVMLQFWFTPQLTFHFV